MRRDRDLSCAWFSKDSCAGAGGGRKDGSIRGLRRDNADRLEFGFSSNVGGGSGSGIVRQLMREEERVCFKFP